MNKFVFTCIVVGSAFYICSSSLFANQTFACSIDLKYQFLPKQKMEFVNGAVKNTNATALPDIDAKYSNKVKVDNLIFTLPGELCETMSACCKADLNGNQMFYVNFGAPCRS